MYSVDNVAQATGDSREKIAAYWPLVVQELEHYGIYSHACQIAVIATVAVECDWAALVEQGDCGYLEGRADLGNTQSGDGCRFKGRGFVQCTGRANYAHYGALLKIDLLAHPERAAEPAIAAQMLALYFRDHGIPAMAGRGDWRAVRIAVNGGLTAIDRFLGVVTALEIMAEPADQQGESMAAWTPRALHVSQYHPDGSGWNDCWEACQARYLQERDGMAKYPDTTALIDAIGRVARGHGDEPGQEGTTLAGADAALAAYSIPVDYTDSYLRALNAPWSICLVNAAALAPAQYPTSFVGGGDPAGDHFILWLPQWQGSAGWFNDPLAYNNGQKDCRYDLDSVAAAFVGAYLLPEIGRGEIGPVRMRLTRKAGLLAQPRHGSLSVATMPNGGTGIAERGTSTDASGEVWQGFAWRDRHGWVPKSYLVAA